MSEQAYPDALQPQYRMHWYTIERVLGQGGFGITYLARDTNLDQLVAIKEYLPVEVASRRPDSTVRSRSDGQRERYRWGLDRFIQEARTLARFDHPNIVRVHSVFEFNGTAYMVMRFEEGDNFGALLDRRGTLPEKDLLRVLLPILDGLELMHNTGFVHRDIKPDNIHIRADGSPVLLDFGSARHALGKAHTLTILVAPGYAPFEQYHSSSENQGPWTDIYGLGATCYRAIAGSPPMDAITRSKGILGSTREVLIPARSVGSGRYSAQLLAAIDHALEFTEKGRPQSVPEWRRELLGEASTAPAVPEGAAAAAPQRAKPPAAPPIAPSNAEATPHIVTPLPANAVVSSRLSVRWSVVPIAWGTAGVIAGAIAISVFLYVDSPQRKAEIQLAQSKQEVESERKRLDEERKIDGEKRNQDEQARRRFEELQKRDEAKRHQDELARLAEQKRLDEQKRRLKPAVAPATKVAPPTEIVTRPPPPILPVAPEPIEPLPVVASAKPKVSPQAAQLKQGEAALKRREFEKALAILEPLARERNTQAQVWLAAIYENGHGVSQDLVLSYIWYSLAARGGDAAGATGRDRLSARLQPSQIRQAETVIESRHKK